MRRETDWTRKESIMRRRFWCYFFIMGQFFCNDHPRSNIVSLYIVFHYVTFRISCYAKYGSTLFPIWLWCVICDVLCVENTTTHTYNAFLKYDLTKCRSYSACHNSIHMCILGNLSIATVQFPKLWASNCPFQRTDTEHKETKINQWPCYEGTLFHGPYYVKRCPSSLSNDRNLCSRPWLWLLFFTCCMLM